MKETRVYMEEEVRSVRRVDPENREIQDSKAAQVLLVHRDAVEETVNVDRKGPLAFLDLRVRMENLEERDKLDTVVLMDRRANQEIRV